MAHIKLMTDGPVSVNRYRKPINHMSLSFGTGFCRQLLPVTCGNSLDLFHFTTGKKREL